MEAEKNETAIEIRDAILNKAEYYFNKKDLFNARVTYEKALEKTIGSVKQLEINLQILQIYYLDNNIVAY